MPEASLLLRFHSNVACKAVVATVVGVTHGRVINVFTLCHSDLVTVAF